MGKNSVTIQEANYGSKKQLNLDDSVVAVTISNEGDWVPIYGWNEQANDANEVETSKPYGLGYPYDLGGNKLFLDFSSTNIGTTKKVKVTIFRKTGC
jgi:hypothetical protein